MRTVPSLHGLLESDPRFLEVHYFLSFGLAFTGRTDEAMDHLLKAYAWRREWPAVTSLLGAHYMALEDFARAIDFFDRTLALVPRYPDALLNKAKALTYSGRYADSLQMVDQLLAQNSLVGDARYWRALNEDSLGRYDEAWADIELADKRLSDAAVPKLAGIIAYHRKQLEVSQDRFELSRRRNRNDCETGFYLGIVLGEQRGRPRRAKVLIETVVCFEKAEEKLNGEIENIRASTQPLDSQTRQIKQTRGGHRQQSAHDRDVLVQDGSELFQPVKEGAGAGIRRKSHHRRRVRRSALDNYSRGCVRLHAGGLTDGSRRRATSAPASSPDSASPLPASSDRVQIGAVFQEDSLDLVGLADELTAERQETGDTPDTIGAAMLVPSSL